MTPYPITITFTAGRRHAFGLVALLIVSTSLPLRSSAQVKSQSEATASSAQSTAPTASPASEEPKKDDAAPIVALNPFQVTAGPDEGYAARETLAGTRFKSELKDVSAQVSVMTREFLQDIASVTVEDAYRYSANVENVQEFPLATGGGGDFNTGVLNTRVANRIRSLASPGVTHDFFRSTVLQDAYNLDRVSISSGPNAILFGNGNPGGIVDTQFIRANLQRPKYEVSFRTDNYNSLRTSVDLNQPVLKDKAAIRFAGVKSRLKYWRKPSGRDDDRYFGTITFKPFPSTTIRAYYENASLDQTPLRNVRMFDQVTPWIKAGRPTFNNGLNNPDGITTANNSIFVRDTSTRNLLILGNNPAPNYQIWGSPASAGTAAGTPYSAITIGPGSKPNQVGADSYTYSLPYDESISPFDVNPNGNGTRNRIKSKIWGASLEQRLLPNLFVQLDYNRERVQNPVSDFLRGTQAAIRADANQFLPDRVTPNPNLGRYFVEQLGESRVFGFRGEKEETRAMLSYELDLSQKNNWLKWLGRHRLAAMYQRSISMEVQQEFVPRIIPAGTPTSTILDNYGKGLYNTLGYRAYLSDPQNPGTGRTYSLSLPFDPIETTTTTMPDGSTYYAGYKNPFGATGGANLTNNLLEGRIFAMQNFFFKNRLVLNLGWRSDHARGARRLAKRKTASAKSAFESIFDLPQPTNWTVFTAGNTTTRGAVGHVLPWFSVFYNESSTWAPPGGLRNPDDGSPQPSATGEGKDYGFMVRLWGDRVSLRLNKYENTNGPSTNEGFRNAILPVVHAIENTLIDRTEDGTIAAPPATNYDPTFSTYVLYGLTADQVSEGYEAELVANPTKNWRLTLNGAKAVATASNLGKAWINFIGQRAPVWAANASLTGPQASTQTIGDRYLGIMQTLNQMAQADGQKVENGREWRANLVTRYSFSEGVLKNSFVGAGYRWRSKQILAYKAVLVDNAFKFAGAPAQLLVPALNSPIFGENMVETELFFGYKRRLGKKVNWSVQLNIRNLFDNQDPMTQRANVGSTTGDFRAGDVTVYAVPEPRSFILTNTFTF